MACNTRIKEKVRLGLCFQKFYQWLNVSFVYAIIQLFRYLLFLYCF